MRTIEQLTIGALTAVAIGTIGLVGSASPAMAQRASCDQVLALAILERQKEREARADLRALVAGFATSYGIHAAIDEDAALRTLGPQFSGTLRRTRERVARHAGNVQRLQAQRARMGCDDRGRRRPQEVAQQQIADPAAGAAAAMGVMGFEIGSGLMGSYGGGYGRSSSGYSGGSGRGYFSGSYGSGRRY